MADFATITRRAFLVAPLAIAACRFDRRVVEFSGSTMGTYYKVTAVDLPFGVHQSEIQADIESSLAKVNQHLSNWDKNSEISQLNASESVEDLTMSPMLAKVMGAAARINEQSLGRFDTTITPLIEAWGFGANGSIGKRPSNTTIANAMAISGHQQSLQITESKLRKKVPQAQVFLSAIGKGFGADEIGNALKDRGVENFLIEIGGDLYASGRNEKGVPWLVGVETPHLSKGGVIDVVGLSNLGMASSGDYRNYFEQDGVRYAHVIDPISGEPIKHHTASATVLAENGMLADAWATAMMTIGSEEGMAIADKNNIAVMFIDRDYESASPRFKVVKNERFQYLQGSV
ncbi:MAG: FAD:protein FMN transferase [Pseudomonadota bacterium]